MLIKQDYNSINFKGKQLKISCYKDPETVPKKTILYFHGGGLVYGNRNDLPDEYIRKFTNSGYNLISFDYPLAPESKLDEILIVCQEQVIWFLNEGAKLLDLDKSEFILFGRSAGAYLALSLAHRLEKNPQALISLYGYYTLTDASFTVPSQYYRQFAQVKERTVRALTKKEPVIEADRNQRYPIYLYARQTGDWMGILTNNEKSMMEKFSLSKENLKDLPPAFLAHAEKCQGQLKIVGFGQYKNVGFRQRNLSVAL